MSDQAIQEVVAVKQDVDLCSSCSICSTVCPYEALTKSPETNKITLDVIKCRVCGLCYANSPSRVRYNLPRDYQLSGWRVTT